MGFDEIVPSNLSAILQPQGAGPSMMGGSNANDSFAELIRGGMPAMSAPQMPAPDQSQPQVQAPEQQTPGILEGAKGFLASNPKLAQMLMTTMATLAGTGDIGKSIQHGALSGFAYDAEKRNQDEKQKKLEMEQQQLDQNNAYRQRSTDISQQNADTQAQQVDQQGRNIESQIAEREARTEDTTANSEVNRKATLKKLDLIDVQIKHAGSQIEREKLQQKRDALQLELDTKYAPTERKLGIGAKSAAIDQTKAATANTQATTEHTQVTTAAAKENNQWQSQIHDFIQSLPGDEFKAVALGQKPKGSKPIEEEFQDYVLKQSVATGEPPDVNKAWNDFKAIRSIGQQGAQSPADNQKAQRQAQYNAAFDAAKPGSTFTFEGKIYRKPK